MLYVTVILASVIMFNRRGVLAVAGSLRRLTILAFSIQHWDDATLESTMRCLVSLLAITITTALAVRIQSTTTTLRSQTRLLDLSHDAIFVRDMNDVIVYWNRGAERLYGWFAHGSRKIAARVASSGCPTSR